MPVRDKKCLRISLELNTCYYCYYCHEALFNHLNMQSRCFKRTFVCSILISRVFVVWFISFLRSFLSLFRFHLSSICRDDNRSRDERETRSRLYDVSRNQNCGRLIIAICKSSSTIAVRSFKSLKI